MQTRTKEAERPHPIELEEQYLFLLVLGLMFNTYKFYSYLCFAIARKIAYPLIMFCLHYIERKSVPPH